MKLLKRSIYYLTCTALIVSYIYFFVIPITPLNNYFHPQKNDHVIQKISSEKTVENHKKKKKIKIPIRYPSSFINEHDNKDLSITGAKLDGRPGDKVYISAHTLPNKEISIRISTLPYGESSKSAQELKPIKSDYAGNVLFEWTIRKNIKPGKYGVELGLGNLPVDRTLYVYNKQGISPGEDYLKKYVNTPYINSDAYVLDDESNLEVSPGENATLTMMTVPNTQCTINVLYYSGLSVAEGLYPQTSDNIGKVSWTWKVGTRTYPGNYRIIVGLNGLRFNEILTVD